METEDMHQEVDNTAVLNQHNRTRRQRLLLLAIGGAVGLIMLVIGSYELLEFMDSTDFCGRLCHEVMDPEYTAFQASPHSKVDCVECHVGSGASYLVKSKASGIPQILGTIFNTYDRPIPSPVENLRPARETCEHCHWPEKFSGDLVRVYHHYLEDEENTEQVITRVFKVGGGEFEVATDIHWHIGADVWYLPLDEKRQDIAWVGVEDGDGSLQVFIDPDEAGAATLERLEEDKLLMDCIDCHNRATHIFYSPQELIDTALTQGRIDSSLPFIKKKGVEALDPPNPSLEQAISKVESIREFYRISYPQVYDEKSKAIDEAIAELTYVAELTTFPDMNVDWETHINNIGHTGCHRCHGKLVAMSGSNKGEPIEDTCNICHYSL
jgi:nitrate/TMAO reductase-like tetraheme cytochrome c subunit